MMKTKKNPPVPFLVAVILLSIAGLLAVSCKKDADAPTVPVKKPYVWVVGDQDSTGYATILFSRDGGATWSRQGLGSPALQGLELNDVWAVDSARVWAVGSDNTVVKTSDGGTTWTRLEAFPKIPERMLYSVSLSGADHIWICGGPGIVYNSNDRGSTWTVQDSAVFRGALVQGIHAVSPQTVYAVGGVGEEHLRGFILRTRDGGNTWDSVVPADNYNRYEWIGTRSYGTDNIVVYGGGSRYIHSTDGGATWRNDSIPGTGGGMSGADINCLTMVDARTWWGAFDYDGIFITSDAGSSWIRQESTGPAGMWLFGIHQYDRNLCVIVGQGSSSMTGKILQTTDGGNTWVLTYYARTWLNKVSFIRN